jgi:hypothetical protein
VIKPRTTAGKVGTEKSDAEESDTDNTQRVSALHRVKAPEQSVKA